MVHAANLGFPRVGADRELKKAVEAYWKGASSAEALQGCAKELRLRHWKLQKDAGIDYLPCNDFTLYDHMLDMIALLGVVPERYGKVSGNVDLDTYFAMARGAQQNGKDVVAMEMTKWFDTNYHYIVPEFRKGQTFSLSSTKPVDQFKETQAAGLMSHPVLVGPITFLMLGKMHGEEGVSPLSCLDALLPVYKQALAALKEAGAEWVQIDEPYLVMDLDEDVRAAYTKTYAALKGLRPEHLAHHLFRSARR